MNVHMCMLYFHIVVLLYCDIVILLYWSVVLYCHIVVLLYCDIVVLSYCSVVFYCHIVVLLYCDIVVLSYYSVVLMMFLLSFVILLSANDSVHFAKHQQMHHKYINGTERMLACRTTTSGQDIKHYCFW
jgi:hypothetical protein